MRFITNGHSHAGLSFAAPAWRWGCRCSTRWCRRFRRSPTPAAVASRLGFIYMPNGVAKNSSASTTGRHPPKAELPDVADPGAARTFRDRLLVVGGLDQNQAEAATTARAGDHTRHELVADWRLSQAHRRADVRNGISADQIAAPVLGKDTALPSLELAIDLNFLAGQCENSYSCAYLNTLAWTSPTTPLPTENNPRGGIRTAVRRRRDRERRAAHARRNRSILDSVLDDFNRLQRQIGPSDRAVVEVGRFRARRSSGGSRALKSEATTSSRRSRPTGVPERFDEHVKLMAELQWLAFRADLTRVVTFMLGRELNFAPIRRSA